MLNSKGEWVYSSAELGRVLNIAPATITSVSRTLFGSKRYQWTLDECVMIKKYMDKVSKRAYAEHMAALAVALGVEVPAEEDDAI